MNNSEKSLVQRVYSKIEDNKILMAIRQGMVMAIPVIMVGTVALMLLNLPISGYSQFIRSLWGGNVYAFLLNIHTATLGIISLVLLFTVSFSYEAMSDLPYKGVVPLVSIVSYIVFTSGKYVDGTPPVFEISVFGSTWIFMAMLCAILSSMSFIWLKKRMNISWKSYADGEDDLFRYIISCVIPAVIVIICFSLINIFIIGISGTANINELFRNLLENFFKSIENDVLRGILFMFFMHFMWFFGVHGGNVLDGILGDISTLFNKEFFDTFVVFGGCGSFLCLILAIFIADKRKNSRNLTKIALMPALFNMNELLLFGIPVVLNPIYIIPFIMTPLVLSVISMVAIGTGIVPPVITEGATGFATWTTPIFLSGYASTGSIAGSILQLVNLIVGTVIYIPFIRTAQIQQKKKRNENISSLTDEVKEMEKAGVRVALTARTDLIGTTAKSLTTDLEYAIENGHLNLFYQPQVDMDGKVHGVEALLRWKLDSGQYVYPPLIILLAEETGLIKELGKFIIRQSCLDTRKIAQKYGEDVKMSLNLTAGQIMNPETLETIRHHIDKYNIKGEQLGLEITEQTALQMSNAVNDFFENVHAMGVRILMDDFGMGHSSMMYLQENQFDVVKLDGALVHDVETNKRSRDIISSIIFLSESLNFKVVAEYVETEPQRKVLEQLGCKIYQGYIYAPALPIDELMDFIEKYNNAES